MVFIGVDLDQIDKMAPRRVKSAPGPIELNQHFGAKTDLLVLECGYFLKRRTFSATVPNLSLLYIVERACTQLTCW